MAKAKEKKEKVNQLFRLRTFQPINYNILAFDTEDNGRGKFICGYIFGEYQNHKGKIIHIEKMFEDKRKMAEFLNGVDRCLIVGKNLDYDLCNLEPFISVKKLYAKSRLVMAKAKSKFIDIGNHLDGRLEDLMPLIKMKKVKLRYRFKRCVSDTKATYLLAKKLESFYLQNGSRFNSTVGGCALEIYKRRFFSHFWKRKDNPFNGLERKGYRGGRCEVFDLKPQKAYSYDINSTYLSIMKDNIFPDPNTSMYFKTDNGFDYAFGKFQGFAHVRVFLPYMDIPPLPYSRKADNKLIFPVGTFEGWWTFDELKLALGVGGKILKVFEYIYYKKSYPYFREYAKWIWRERQKAKNPFWEMMIKKLGNSLYGKFGQQNEKGIYHGRLDDFKGDLKDGMLSIVSTVGGVDYLALTGGKKESSNHTFVCISAYISSLARIKLYQEMVKHDVIYCDTDSMKIKKKMKSSTGLGGWYFEGRRLFRGYRPKLYKFGGKLKIKGVPSRNVKLRWTVDKLIATFKKPSKFKETIRRGMVFNRWEKTKKEILLTDDKRVFDKEGCSRPIQVELREL